MAKPNRLARQDKEPHRVALRSQDVQVLLDHFEISHYDYLLIGDGSGSSWNMPCGWACILIERRTGTGRFFGGAVNDGTVNFAELMAYVQPLQWIVNKTGASRRAVTVHVISDSQYAVESNTRTSADKNVAPVAMLNCFKRFGMTLRFHWMKRNSHHLSTLADSLSKKLRTLLKEYLRHVGADVQQQINISLLDEPFGE